LTKYDVSPSEDTYYVLAALNEMCVMEEGNT